MEWGVPARYLFLDVRETSPPPPNMGIVVVILVKQLPLVGESRPLPVSYGGACSKGARLPCKQTVEGSIPFSSTKESIVLMVERLAPDQ